MKSISTSTSTTPDRVSLVEGARTDIICVDAPAGVAGALLYWQLSGAIEHAALAAAWDAEGLAPEDCPAPPTPALALRLAIQSQAHGGRFARSTDDGWVLAEPLSDAESSQAEDGDQRWMAASVLRARLGLADARGHLPLLCEGDEHLAAIVRAHYEAALVDWPSISASAWLPRYVLGRCDGLALRCTGGFYFIPPAAMERFHRVRRVLEAVSRHKIYLIQALRTEDAVSAILAALKADTDAAVEAAVAEGDTARKASSRLEVVRGLRDRLVRYEALLGERYEDLGQSLDASERALALIALGTESGVGAAAE